MIRVAAAMQYGDHAYFKPAAKMLLSEKGSKIHLTEKETLMLMHLYRAGGKAVTRKELLEEVWG